MKTAPNSLQTLWLYIHLGHLTAVIPLRRTVSSKLFLFTSVCGLVLVVAAATAKTKCTPAGRENLNVVLKQSILKKKKPLLIQVLQ